MSEEEEEKAVDDLGEGIKYRLLYEEALSKHKATDMKHDKLTLGENGSFWEHYYKLIPPSVEKEIRSKNRDGNFIKHLSDSNFMETYLHGEPNRPIKGMLDLIIYCMGIEDLSLFNNDFGKDSGGLADGGRSKKIFVKFGDNIIYEYDVRLQNLLYSARTEGGVPEMRGATPIEPSVMLKNLGIKSGSLLNIDFQYHLWDLLKSGTPDREYEIFLLMNPENINDPAGKFNVNEKAFKRPNGVNAKLAICSTQENTIYSCYDKRVGYTPGGPVGPVEPGADFFSRFDVGISGIKKISTMCGLIKSFGVELTIKSDNPDDNFMYSGISKANNSNATVRNELSKLYKKYLSTAPGSRQRKDVELLMAAETAKKGGGDDLQLLSHWNVHNRRYDIIDPISKAVLHDQKFDKTTNPVFFVSHDGPTIVRALIEGNNVLFMYSQVISGKKYECAISLTRGAMDPPSFRERLQSKIRFLPDITSVNEEIEKFNLQRQETIKTNLDLFETTCRGLEGVVAVNKTGYIKDLLEKSVYLCLVRDSLSIIEPLDYGMKTDAERFYASSERKIKDLFKDKKKMQKSIDSGAIDEDEAELLLLVVNSIEEKNKIINTERLKYDPSYRINKKLNSGFVTKLKGTPEYLSCSSWQKSGETSRRGVIENKFTSDIFLELLSKQFVHEEAVLFYQTLESALERLFTQKTENIYSTFVDLISLSKTRLPLFEMGNMDDITEANIETINSIASQQMYFAQDVSVDPSNISNIDDAWEVEFGGAGKYKGGRATVKTILFCSDDRGVPYSPSLSKVCYSIYQNKKNEELFLNDAFFAEADLPLGYNPHYDPLPVPLTIPESHLGPIEDPKRTPASFTAGGGSKKYENVLISGKLLEYFPLDKKTEYIKNFKRIFPKATDDDVRKWKHFKFPNPMISFHLLFLLKESFFENGEDKIKHSSFLPEFLAFFFTFKRYTDGIFDLFEELIAETNGEKMIELIKKIRVVSSIFNQLFFAIPYLENGEELIRNLLGTNKTSIIISILSNLVNQNIGNIEYTKKNKAKIEKNIEMLLRTSIWEIFVEKTGAGYFDKAVNLFRKFDNSILFLFSGGFKFEKQNSISDMTTLLTAFDRVNKNFTTVEGNLKANVQFLKFQDSSFHRFLANLKTYNKKLLDYSEKDILNNPVEFILSSKTSSAVQSSSKNKSSRKNRFYSKAQSMPVQESRLVSVKGGTKKSKAKISARHRRKTRRNRK